MLRKSLLRRPAARRTPGYFWTLSDRIEPEKLRGQLEDMCARGARSLCLHPLPPEFRPLRSRMSPPYLSEAYNSAIARIVDICAELGMKFFLYDEGGWPSGSACGKVLRSDPERFAPRYAVGDGRGGYRIETVAVDPDGAPQLPCLLAPGATEKFLELTHEAFKRHFGKHFGKTVHIAFTDEPIIQHSYVQRIAWVDDLPEQFRARKGYDLLPYLGEMLAEGIRPPYHLRRSRLAEVRRDYCDVMSQLFAERYLLPIRDWCRRNKLLSGGHLNGEDSWFIFDRNGFGNILRSLRAMDCPGVDMIWRQLHRDGRLHPFPKLASSAAHLNGNRDALAEMFAIYGSGLTPGEMKFLLDYMLVCGINTFVFSNIPSHLDFGQLAGGRPCFGPADPLWKYFRELHIYTGALAGVLSRGRPATKIALFFDMRSLWLETCDREYSTVEQIAAAERLRRTQHDFDYVSDDEILEGRLRGGKLRIGKMSFSALVLPPLCELDRAVRDKVELLRRKGFPVLTVGEAVETLPPTLRIAPAAWDLLVMKRDLGHGEALYMVMNTAGTPRSVELTAPERQPVAAVDAVRGEFFSVASRDGCWQWDFAPFEARVFILGAAETAPAPAPPGDVVRELKTWTLAPSVRYYADEPRREPQSAAPVAVRPGDWRPVLGEDFSGDGVYRTTFRLDDPQCVRFLDLGKVNYACEVVLNGQPLGKKFFPPHVFDVSGRLRRGVNRLEITVTNTLANAITDEVQQYWAAHCAPIPDYNALEQGFEKESLPSGLFGPVRLRK